MACYLRSSLIGCALILTPTVASAQFSLLEYGFNEPSGNTVFAGGSASNDGSPSLTIRGDGAVRGAGGTGVTGTITDRAFDSRSRGGGFSFDPGRAQHSGDFAAIDNLVEFTLVGWYRLSPGAERIGRQSALTENIDFQTSSSSQGGFGLTGAAVADAGALRLRVNEGAGVESRAGTYSEVGEWVNFAVSYDGTNARFYKGLINQQITLVDTVRYAQGRVRQENQPLVIGASSGGSSIFFSTFTGLLDNIGIYGQALNTTQLESIRLSVVPEPASLSVLGLSALLLRRRR